MKRIISELEIYTNVYATHNPLEIAFSSTCIRIGSNLNPQKVRIAVDVSQILIKTPRTRRNILVRRRTPAHGPRSRSGNTREDPAAPLVHRVAVHTT